MNDIQYIQIVSRQYRILVRLFIIAHSAKINIFLGGYFGLPVPSLSVYFQLWEVRVAISWPLLPRGEASIT